MGSRKRKKSMDKGHGKWQVSVAEIMENNGHFIQNEKLSFKHPKMKNPSLALKK